MERERWAHKELELLEKERQAAQDEAIVKNTMAEFPHLTFGLRRKAAGLPPKEPGVGRKRKARRARPHPGPLPQERERTKAGRGKSKSSRIQAVGDEARPEPNSPPQERGLSDAAPGESNQIKPNQTYEDLPGIDLPEAQEGGGIPPGQT
jgi:hypothetical protein